MKNRKGLVRTAMLAFCAAVTGVILTSAPASGAKPCPWGGLQCTDIYNPVICSNGVVYGNACYARRACATGCVAY
jgi:hypothetical protein